MMKTEALKKILLCAGLFPACTGATDTDVLSFTVLQVTTDH